MLSAELPANWQAQEWSTQGNSTLWQITSPSPPVLNHLGCEVTEEAGLITWCMHEHTLWLLTREGETYWLSAYQREKPTSVTSRSWYGEELQSFRTDGQEIAVYRNQFGVQQIQRFINLRHTHRNPQFTELSHGRFYLALQNPLEHVFIYTNADGSVLVSARTEQ